MARLLLEALYRGIRAGAADFIARCDAGYDRLVAETARRARENLTNSPILLLAGPSASGKTTTALRIRAALAHGGTGCRTISLDDYYRPLDDPDYPRTPDGALDYESPLSLDAPLLRRHLDALTAGREIAVPHFDFHRRRRDPDAARPLRLGRDEAVIFEGIHALHPLFAGRCPGALRIYVDACADLYDGETLLLHRRDGRLLRRCVRDRFHRSAPALETLGLWANVCRGEDAHIRPCRDGADVRLDTSLGYELPVLAAIAAPEFDSLPEDAPMLDRVRAIRRAAALLPPVDPALLPATSLLKEEFMQ